MKTITAAATHRGAVRELNEDAVLSLQAEGLWAVADGMGGHDAGDVASAGVVETLSRMQLADTFETSLANLQTLIQIANRALLEASDETPRHRQPGTTIAALLIQGEEGAVTWAGDSRVYRFRNGELEQLTRDHSQVQDLVDQGLVDPADAELHPMAHVITRAIGFDEPARLETRRLSIRPGDRFLLCSDGLIRVVEEQEIAEFMALTSPETRAPALVDLTLERGAPDNVTVVCVDCPAKG
ncbi:MAG: protein phosphatase 2C domain-containing protein [Xanthomonadales bacterium]|jgi:serine/threonine protein phosphatase PrpC|nr:protein phosphatase 2C domain-containing protein [Xanthomonadales bacterium]